MYNPPRDGFCDSYAARPRLERRQVDVVIGPGDGSRPPLERPLCSQPLRVPLQATLKGASHVRLQYYRTSIDVTVCLCDHTRVSRPHAVNRRMGPIPWCQNWEGSVYSLFISAASMRTGLSLGRSRTLHTVCYLCTAKRDRDHADQGGERLYRCRMPNSCMMLAFCKSKNTLTC